MPLYHREIYFPPEITALFKDGVRFDGLSLTAHAAEAAANDRYGKIEVPTAISVRSSDIVEAEVEDKKLIKIVVRQPYDSTRDRISVIGIRNKKAFLKTLWYNLNSDKHATLDKKRYSTRHY